MTASQDSVVRVATQADAEAIGRLLHDFNREFDEPTRAAAELAQRAGRLLAAEQISTLLVGREPAGFAVLHFRPSLSTDALECYVSELYVIPTRRRHGLGRALMTAAIELARHRGADQIELAMSEDNAPARGLYESLEFSNRERGPGSPVMYFYEREL